MRFPPGSLPDVGLVEFMLPGADAIKMGMVRITEQPNRQQTASLQALNGGWAAYRAMSLWLFHTPAEALCDFPPGVPAIASTLRV